MCLRMSPPYSSDDVTHDTNSSQVVKSNVYTLRWCQHSVSHDNQHQIVIWTGKVSESMKSEVLRAN